MSVDFAQGPADNSQRIASADQLLIGKRDQRIGALDLPQGFDNRDDHFPPAAGDEMKNDFGVGGRLIDCAALDKSRRKVSALVRLPLWASAKPPESSSANKGWTLRKIVSPVVE